MLLVSVLVAGCVTTRNGNFHDIYKPVYWQNQQELVDTPDNIVRQIIANNTYYSDAVKLNQAMFCDIYQPTYWQDAQQLVDTPDNIVRQILINNETYLKICK